MKCVLFDLDGTLFDSSEGIISCYKHALAHFGIQIEDDRELNKVLGPSLYISFHDFFHLDGEQLTEAVRIYRERYQAEGIYQVRMYNGVESLLSLLKQNGFTICLATTKPQGVAETILQFSGLTRYFDAICGANPDGSRSDKAELIEFALKLTSFTDKNEVVMIGDRFYDIKGAVSAGVHSIGVTYGFGSRKELVDAGAEYTVDAPLAIANILNRVGGYPLIE